MYVFVFVFIMNERNDRVKSLEFDGVGDIFHDVDRVNLEEMQKKLKIVKKQIGFKNRSTH